MSERKYKYHTVNLPESLAKKIEEVIESGNHGYTSIPDFVKSAVRRYLRDLGYLVKTIFNPRFSSLTLR